MMDDRNRLDWLWLSCLPLGRSVDRMALVRQLGDVHTLAAAPRDALLKAGVDDGTIDILTGGRSREEALRLCARAKTLGMTVLHPDHPEYPPLLRTIPDLPPVLYRKGNLGEVGRCIAVVGSRRCTGYGVAMAERLSGELAEAGYTIVSGLARGIDTAAHSGALRVGGRTAAVLANGLASVYPPENRALAERMLVRGTLMTECAPDVEPAPFRFPFRNRIISGMAEAVLIVEAGEKSGSLITVQYALDQGREVFAVPGNVTSICSRGSNRIIREGAGLVQDAEDLLEALGENLSMAGRSIAQASASPACNPSAQASASPVCNPSAHSRLSKRWSADAGKDAGKDGRKNAFWKLSLTQRLIAGRLEREALDANALCRQTGLSAQELAVSLLEMELSGIAARGLDGLFRLTK